MRWNLKLTAEVKILLTMLVLAVLGLIFMGSLVAAPKLLLGRSLSAIPPSIFPAVILSLMAVLSVSVLLLLNASGDQELDSRLTNGELRRGAVFFAIMTGYALAMEPVGFLISSGVTVALLSWHMGNRSWLQAILLAVVGPVLLYLTATRLLAVSLPELNFIELAYAWLLRD